MLLDTLICSSSKLSQVFPIDKGLFRHYVPNSDAQNFHSRKLSQGYESIGVQYSIENKKLKTKLDELDDLLDKFSVTKVCYLTDSIVQILLNTAVIIYVTLENGELQDINIVQSLAKVLRGQLVFDDLFQLGYLHPQYMLLICSGKLCLTTNATSPEQFEKILQYKVINLDPDFCYETHLSVLNNMVLLWTPEGNIVVYTPIGPGVQELCRFRSQYKLCNCSFSPVNSSIVTCQLKPGSQPSADRNTDRQTYQVISVTYDIVGKGSKRRVMEILKHRVTHVKAEVTTASYNHTADKVLLGLANGKILLHCQQLKRNFSTDIASKKAITSVTWHKSDSFIVVVLKNGYIQIYDETLQLISASFGGFPECTTLDLNRIFNNVKSVSCVSMSKSHLSVMMDRGPLISLKMLIPNTDENATYFIQILHMYIYRDCFKQASRLVRNCLYRFKSEDELLHILTLLMSNLLNKFTESHFSIGAELLLQLKKEKIQNIELLDQLVLKLLLRGLHNKLYRESLKLARKWDADSVMSVVDRYVRCCGLTVTCKSPEQIKLTRKQPPKSPD